MGKGTDAMSDTIDPREETKALERKADAIRRDVDLLMREVDKRRRHLFGMTSPLREHPVILAGAAGVVGVGLLGLGLLIKQRYERQHSLTGKLSAVGAAIGRVARKPERVARREPDLTYRLLVAAGTAAVGVLARKGMVRVLSEAKVNRRRDAGVLAETAPSA